MLIRRAANLSLLNFLSLFRDLLKSTRFSGGRGCSRIVQCSPKADAIQWGGGSSRICPGSPKPDAIQWGGGVLAKSHFYPTSSDIRIYTFLVI